MPPKPRDEIQTTKVDLNYILACMRWVGLISFYTPKPGMIERWWKQYKKELIALHEERAKKSGTVGTRLFEHMQELEKKNPRKLVGYEKFYPSWTADGPPAEPELEEVFEEDIEFLMRTGNLYDWEIEKIGKDYRPAYLDSEDFIPLEEVKKE